MADTPNPGETVIPEAPSNAPVQTPAATPVANAGDTAEVERLRKDADQARLRANQLENELKKKNDAEAEAERQRLEKNEEYKTLAEQEKAKREALEAEKDEREQKEALSVKKSEAQKDYPSQILEQAKSLGIDLTSADEDDVKAYTDKLDKLVESFSSNQAPRGNNGYTPQINNGVTAQDIRAASADPDKIADLIRQRNPDGALAQMITRRS